MKNKRLFSVILTAMLAGLLVLTACPEPEFDTDAVTKTGTPPAKTSVITGTITLTDVSNPAPEVYISVEGIKESKKWYSDRYRINLGSGSGTFSDINWSISINIEDGFFASECDFYLWVKPQNNNGFEIKIPGSKTVNSINDNVGSLGTVSLNAITLSGTINVTYNGQPVPYLQIIAYTPDQSIYGTIFLDSPEDNQQWSIPLPVLSASTQINFRVRGYSDDDDYEVLFYKILTLDPDVNAYNADVSGITLNVGNISNTPVDVVPLTANVWKDGEISTGGSVQWYSINVINGTKYYLWWNDKYKGNGTKTLDIDVYAYDNTNNPIYLADNDSAWNNSVSFTATGGKVYVRVRAYEALFTTGTYAIVYSTISAKPNNSKYTVSFSINGGSGTAPSVITEYNGTVITLPDAGDLTKSGYSFGGWNTSSSGAGTNYNAGSSYTVNGNVTLYAKWNVLCTVTFDSNGGTGTVSSISAGSGSYITIPSGSGLTKSGYGFICWNTSSFGTGTSYNAGDLCTINGSSTLYAKWGNDSIGGEANPISLTASRWANGEITASTPDKELWYSFNVTKGTTYYVWWNDGSSIGGDGSKTLDVGVSAYLDNSYTTLSGFNKVDTAWTSPKSFTPDSTGKIKLKVVPYISGNTGTFAIVYSTSNTKPSSYTVTFNSNGGKGTVSSITASPNSTVTLPNGSVFNRGGYTFAGWNTNSYGTGTNYNAGANYLVSSNVTLYAKWNCNLSGSGTETDPFQLTADSWVDDIITSTNSDSAVWYSFNVTNETSYYVWWNGGNSSILGDGTKTLEVRVSAYFNGSSIIGFSSIFGWSSPNSFTPNSNGTVKLKVVPSTSGNIGTFAIVYSTTNTRPAN